ncbi:unnamed protein product [Paramecium sonneborni]|uniref:Transmembrane protein n=1 Tax=Paramecium sonneborni TaxID=65129 RepID=A0A8S1R413_9CILI|nr:unnamed protein product [Paramecium sonneborni]
MIKSITELCYHELSKLMQSNQSLQSKSNITYNVVLLMTYGIVSNDIQLRYQNLQQQMKITRSHNINLVLENTMFLIKFLILIVIKSIIVVLELIINQYMKCQNYSQLILQTIKSNNILQRQQLSLQNKLVENRCIQLQNSLNLIKVCVLQLEEKLLQFKKEVYLNFHLLRLKKIFYYNSKFIQKYGIKKSALRFQSP